jgi:hypothetical protein
MIILKKIRDTSSGTIYPQAYPRNLFFSNELAYDVPLVIDSDFRIFLQFFTSEDEASYIPINDNILQFYLSDSTQSDIMLLV